MKIVQLDSSQNASKCSVIEEKLVAKQNFMAFDEIGKYDKFVHLKIWRISYQASKFWCFWYLSSSWWKYLFAEKRLSSLSTGKKRKREVVGSGYDSDYSECFRPLLWLFWSNKEIIRACLTLSDDFVDWWWQGIFLCLRILSILNISSFDARSKHLWE